MCYCFYANKEFYFHISFSPNIINYVITRKRLNAIKIRDINNHIYDILVFIRDKLHKI